MRERAVMLVLEHQSKYAACSQPPSTRAVRDAELKKEIKRVYEENYSVYGYRVNKQGQCQYCGRRWRFWQKQSQ